MKRTQDKINRLDLLLMLLLAEGSSGDLNEPIEGKTRLQKELFLLQKKLKDSGIKRPYSFRPYQYGPYCKEIYNDIEWLKKKRIIEENSSHTLSGGVMREFKLSSKGVEESMRMINERKLHDQFDIIKQIKREFNRMSVVALVEFTHNQYAEYVV